MDDSNRTNIDQIILKHIDNEEISDFYFVANGLPAMRHKNEIFFISNEKITEEDIKSFLENQNIKIESIPFDFGITYHNKRFRCNLDKRWQGWDLTIRVLPSRIKTLDELKLPKYLYNIMDNKHGFVLICGPTGSGKSTTLASLINYVNEKYSKKIVMLEDPIEYIITEKNSIICQREIEPGGSFFPGLRFAMRQRPDIIVVGEIRDHETALVALQAAETGHLVLSTLHTYSVEQTLIRFVDMFPDEAKSDIKSSLSATLKAIVIQRLIRGKNQQIKPAYEVCFVTRPISQTIRVGKFQQIKNLMLNSEGSVPFEESLKKLIEEGHISYEEAEKYIDDKTVL